MKNILCYVALCGILGNLYADSAQIRKEQLLQELEALEKEESEIRALEEEIKERKARINAESSVQDSAQNDSVARQNPSIVESDALTDDKRTQITQNERMNKKSGFYFNIALGLGTTDFHFSREKTNELNFIPLSLSLGGQYRFSEMWGINYYANALIGISSYNNTEYTFYGFGNASTFGGYAEDSKKTVGSLGASVNLDVIGDFYQSISSALGYRLGLGIGADVLTTTGGNDTTITTTTGNDTTTIVDSESSTFTNTFLQINVGLKFVWAKKHGIEIIMRDPIAYFSQKENLFGLQKAVNAMHFTLGYSITF